MIDRISCPVCKISFGSTGLGTHIKHKHSKEDYIKFKTDKNKPENFVLVTQDNIDVYKCKDCDFKTPKKQVVQYHWWRKHTPAGVSHSKNTIFGTRPSWNKGLTKHTDERVKQRGINLTENVKSGKTVIKGHPHSEETKRKISIKRKEYLEKHPDKVPYVLNHTSKKSYPEQYFLNCFEKVTNITFQHHVFRYKLDFANVDEKIYLEIDGDQHYSDQRIVEHDIRRTKKLDELGWICYRIRWSEFKKLPEESKKAKIIETKILLKCIEEI